MRGVRNARAATSRRRALRAGARPSVGIVALVLACLLLVPRRGGAKPFDPAGEDWEGCAELIRLAEAELGRTRVIASAALDYGRLTPDDGVMILHPERVLDSEELAKFMRAGGRVVLFDDFGRGDAVLRHFGMSRVPAPRRPAEFLRNNPAFALAEPASAHPVVSDVRRVVTNHPSGLTHPDLSPILRIRSEHDEERDGVVAVAGAVGKGRLLVAGDPSIVMNAMLRYAGNKAFAGNVIRYLVEQDAWGKRGGRLFVVTGNVAEHGAFGQESGALDDVARALREALETVRRDGAPEGMAYALAIAVGFLVVVWVGSRAGQMHKRVEPSFVRPSPLVAQGGVAGRAAVLAAPQTSRALAVLELKSALEEQMASLLALPQVPPQTELLARVEAEGLLDPQGMRSLRQVLLRMSNVETALVAQRKGGKDSSVRDQDVVSIAETVRELITMAQTRARAGHAGHQDGAEANGAATAAGRTPPGAPA